MTEASTDVNVICMWSNEQPHVCTICMWSYHNLSYCMHAVILSPHVNMKSAYQAQSGIVIIMIHQDSYNIIDADADAGYPGTLTMPSSVDRLHTMQHPRASPVDFKSKSMMDIL